LGHFCQSGTQEHIQTDPHELGLDCLSLEVNIREVLLNVDISEVALFLIRRGEERSPWGGLVSLPSFSLSSGVSGWMGDDHDFNSPEHILNRDITATHTTRLYFSSLIYIYIYIWNREPLGIVSIVTESSSSWDDVREILVLSFPRRCSELGERGREGELLECTLEHWVCS
jgi:hypothetical protein